MRGWEGRAQGGHPGLLSPSAVGHSPAQTRPWSCRGCCWRWLRWAQPPAWVNPWGGHGGSLLPYEPRVPPGALLGKVTATTFALERPCCVFHRLANASDTVWLVVAFANASATFRNPPSRADVPLYEGLPTAHAYMTLETAAAAYACSVPGPVLRVGGDAACGGQHGQTAYGMGGVGPPGEFPIPRDRRVSPRVWGGFCGVWSLGGQWSCGDPAQCLLLPPRSAEAWRLLCHRDFGAALSQRSYRTHHISPALPQPLCCGCCRAARSCSAPRAPCAAE
uniref:Uroplakin 3B n=1 Tax=Anas zonorhyncha TaxID=75864 RepID=A0A8B9VQT5_9AVES